MSNHYIYLFIRKDLSPQQQIIQASHVTHLIGTKQPEITETPNTVLIGLHSKDGLSEMVQYLDSNEIPYELFYEPDIEEYTAIATYPLRGKDRTPLRRFSLM
jgi:transcriptional regulatory protein LevR